MKQFNSQHDDKQPQGHIYKYDIIDLEIEKRLKQ